SGASGSARDLGDVARRALVGAAGERRVGPERLAHGAVATDGLPRVLGALHLRPTLRDDLVGDVEVEAAPVDVDLHDVALLDQADETAARRLRRDVADGDARRPAG